MKVTSVIIAATLLCGKLGYSSEDDSKEDNFDFLATRHPELVEKSGQKFERVQSEDYEEDLGGEAGVKNYFKRYTKSKVGLFGTDVFSSLTSIGSGIPHKIVVDFQISELSRLKENHSMKGFFQPFFERKFKKHHVLEDILLGAEYIYQTVQDRHEDNVTSTVLFLGRTPCIVQKAYEQVLAAVGKESHQRSVHLNISGHPDAETMRGGDYKSNPDRTRIRNMVTPEKLSHYLAYMDEKGLGESQKLYIVDMVNTGGGLNSFMRLLTKYYRTKSREVPDVTLLMLSDIIDIDPLTDRSYEVTPDQTFFGENILTFREDKKINLKPFSIKTCIVPIHSIVLQKVLDNDEVQMLASHGVEYPAQRWVPDFDEERERGGAYQAELYPYLEKNFSKFLKFHMQKIK